MTNALLQIAVFAALVTLTVKPLGAYMAAVFTGERTLLSPVLDPLERGIYRLGGINPEQEQHWTGYALACLLFSVAGFVFLYGVLRLQGFLPLNPQGLGGVPRTPLHFWQRRTLWTEYIPKLSVQFHRWQCTELPEPQLRRA